jgi:hypothetical protein
VAAGSARVRGVVLLSRALCRTKVLDLAGVRVADRGAALRLQLAAWAPFDRPGFIVGLRAGRALAFAWDEAFVRPHLDDGGLPAEVSVLPEALFRRPMAEGIRLVQGLEGVEAQVWADGLPVRSHWWPHLPEQGDWREFLAARDAVGASWPVEPSLAEVDWLRRPWLACKPPEKVGRGLSRVEALTWLTAACLASGLAGLAGRSWHQAHLDLEDANRLRESVQQQVGPYIVKRDEALRLASQADSLARGLAGGQPLMVFDQLRERLPSKGVILQDLQLQGDKVRVVFAMSPEVSRASLVEQLKSGTAFESVSESDDPVAPAVPGTSAVVFDLRLATEKPLRARAEGQAGQADKGGPAPAASAANSSPAPASAAVRREARP